MTPSLPLLRATACALAIALAGPGAAAAGDVNGDGRLDVIVGAPQDHNGRAESGSAYVFFTPAGR